MKTKEEMNAPKEETTAFHTTPAELTCEELAQAAGGSYNRENGGNGGVILIQSVNENEILSAVPPGSSPIILFDEKDG